MNITSKITEADIEEVVQFLLKKYPGSPEGFTRVWVSQLAEIANFDPADTKVQTSRLGALKLLGDAMGVVRKQGVEDGRREGTHYGWRLAKASLDSPSPSKKAE